MMSTENTNTHTCSDVSCLQTQKSGFLSPKRTFFWLKWTFFFFLLMQLLRNVTWSVDLLVENRHFHLSANQYASLYLNRTIIRVIVLCVCVCVSQPGLYFWVKTQSDGRAVYLQNPLTSECVTSSLKAFEWIINAQLCLIMSENMIYSRTMSLCCRVHLSFSLWTQVCVRYN